MRITRLQRRKNRVRIYVQDEDEPRAELTLDLLLRAGFGVGDVLDPARLEELEREDAAYRAKDAALSLLSVRARSRAELRDRLMRKEFPAGLIEQTLSQLEAAGFLDDRAFAESFVRDRLRLRPRGPMVLIQELRRKGVAPELAQDAVARVMDATGAREDAIAREAAEAWARRNASLLRTAERERDGKLRARRRLYGHLARRGFAPDAVRMAVDHILPH